MAGGPGRQTYRYDGNCYPTVWRTELRQAPRQTLQAFMVKLIEQNTRFPRLWRDGGHVQLRTCANSVLGRGAGPSLVLAAGAGGAACSRAHAMVPLAHTCAALGGANARSHTNAVFLHPPPAPRRHSFPTRTHRCIRSRYWCPSMCRSGIVLQGTWRTRVIYNTCKLRSHRL